jgi:hypothetical protein
MIKSLGRWLASIAAMFVAVGIWVVVSDHFESDADRKADQAAATARVNKVIGNFLDKSGILDEVAAVTSMSNNFYDDCKTTLVSSNANVKLSDEYKTTFCTCAKRGVTKYFYTLSKSEMTERSKLSNARQQSPLDVRQKVYVTCSSSLDAYPSAN